MKISNNRIATLLVLAIIISTVSTWLSVSYIDSLNQLTGKATSDVGNTTLTVTGEVSCTTEVDRLITFGDLARGATRSSEGISDYIILRNDGNVNINVTINVTSSVTQLWDVSAYHSPNIHWRIRCNSALSGTCQDTYFNIPSTQTLLVSELSSINTENNLTVAVNVTVPLDEPAGIKNGQITFYCVES